MQKIHLLTILGIVLFLNSYAQNSENYSKLIAEGDQLYDSQEYLKSAQAYSTAFRENGDIGNVNDRYNSACSWALADIPDSSFVQLFRIAEKGKYSNLSHISTDPDLNSLHGKKRWDKVIAIVTENKEAEEANYDKPLVAELDSIFDLDQGYRRQIDEIQEKYGNDSDEMRAHWMKIYVTDSINETKVVKILDERGWLGPDVIGQQGNSALFLVIQHADIATQQKYLPMMRDAVKKGNASPGSLALLEDRVALRTGEKQIYGSQIKTDPETGEHYVMPLADPDNVDKRREEVGLGPIKDYVSRWQIEWDVEVYKKNLPKYEALQQK